MQEINLKLRKYFLVCAACLLPAFCCVSCDDEDEGEEDLIAEIQENKEAGEKFLLGVKDQAGVVVDPSGLMFEVLEASAGQKPGATDTVCIQYSGFLVDGKQFISKSDTVAMEDLEEGLHIGLRHMNQGAKNKLYIPYYLMYGATSNSFIFDDKEIKVKEYSALVYEMQLDSVIFAKK